MFLGDRKIVFKTDNSDLFEYSVLSLLDYNYKIIDLSLDLHKREDYNNVMTEYEKNNAAKLILARLCIKDKALDEAHTLLDNPGRELSEDQDYKDLVSALTLAEQAAESPEIKELERKFKEDENNAQIAVEYAVALSDAGKKAQALEILFNILKKDLSEEKIKKTFLDMLNTMSGDPLQKEYRRKLYTIMY